MSSLKNWTLKATTAALCLALLVACGSADDKAKSYYENGMKLLEAQDFSSASVEFRNALKLKDNYADAWYGMAKIEEHSQNWPRVFGNLTKALDADPKHLKSLQMMAALMLLSNNTADAAKRAKSALEIDPNNADLIALNASIMMKSGNREGALKEANRALSIAPSHADASMVIAGYDLEQGRFKEAIDRLNGVLKDNPKNLALYVTRIGAYEKAGDKTGLEQSLKDVIAAFPEQNNLRNALVTFYVRENRIADAEKELRTAFSSDTANVNSGMMIVQFVRSQRGQDAARAELDKIATQAKDPIPYRIAAAQMDFSAGKTEESIAQLRDLAAKLGITDQGIDARQKLGEQLIALKRYDEAQSVIDEILKNDAQNVGGLKLRGVMRLVSGKPEQAIEDFRAAVNLDPKNIELRVGLAGAYEQSGQIDLASREYQEAYGLSDFNSKVGIQFASFLIRRGNEDRAREILTELSEKRPTDKEVLVALGDFLTSKKDWAGVEKIAKTLAALPDSTQLSDSMMSNAMLGRKDYDGAATVLSRLSANNGDAAVRAVQAMLAAGKEADAQKFIDNLLATDPKNPQTLVLKGGMLQRNGDLEGAKKNFEAAVAAGPRDTVGYLALAGLSLAKNDFESAKTILDQGTEKVDDKSRLVTMLAQLYESREDFANAIVYYEKALALNPTSLVVINNLASLIADHKTEKADLDRAAQLAEALRQSPIAAFRETLGWALVQSGRVKEGLNILEKAIGELANNPVANYHLGEAYKRVGKKDLSEKYLSAALQFSMSDAFKAQVSASLEEAKKL